jgi:hypothetical protein
MAGDAEELWRVVLFLGVVGRSTITIVFGSGLSSRRRRSPRLAAKRVISEMPQASLRWTPVLHQDASGRRGCAESGQIAKCGRERPPDCESQIWSEYGG